MTAAAALRTARTVPTVRVRRVAVAAVLWIVAAGNALAIVWLWLHGGGVTKVHSTGRPPTGVLSVTIAGPELATADAYATAAFAMGAAGPDWTARLPGYEAMTVLTGDVVVTTPGFRRLQSAAARAISSVG